MIATRLICIDGMPGSGKSTTSQRLWLHLLKHGHAARWCYEHGPDSPIWRGAERFRLTQSDIADPMMVHDLVLSRWQALVAELATGSTITVMESSLLHSTISIMAAMDFDDDVILRCIQDVARAIAPLRPVSLYLVPDDVGQALRAICAQRRHDQFEAPLIELMSKTRAFKAHGLAGFDGVVQFLQHCREIIDRAFSALPCPKLAIGYSAQAWSAYEKQITDFLALPPMPPMSGQVEQPARFVGRYKDPASDADIVVAADDNGLYLDDERGTRLMHHDGEVFHVNAIWLEISFREERDGAFQSVGMRGHVPDLSPVWVRVPA